MVVPLCKPLALACISVAESDIVLSQYFGYIHHITHTCTHYYVIALSLQFPDLRLVELIKDHFPYQTPHSHRRTHTERGTTKFIGKTILPMTKLGKSVTSFNSKDPTKYQVRSIYRPSQRETSSYSTQRSYTSIVNQQLKPYIRRRNNSAS